MYLYTPAALRKTVIELDVDFVMTRTGVPRFKFTPTSGREEDCQFILVYKAAVT